MQSTPFLACLAFLFLVAGCIAESSEAPAEVTGPEEIGAEMPSLSLTSPAFQHNGYIPSTYTCDGQGINPPLNIQGVPENAQSLVLIMDDPDAADVVGYTWDHWVVFNIDPSTTRIQEGREPQGVRGVSSSDMLGYQGSCPPAPREHAYSFRLYALDTMLNLPEGSTKAEVEQAMHNHILEETELVGRYRSN